jgi:glycosyltransferase involved in cell wall biosynthesis
MKIGINARFLALPYTGIGQYTRGLVRAMAKLKPEHEFVLFTPELVDLDLPPNCKQVRVAEKPYRSASLRKAYWEHILVPREMERFGINLAHFPYPSNPWRKLPFPTIVTVHDVIPWKLSDYRQRLRSRIYHFYASLALKKADQIITVSEFSKREIVETLKIKEKSITVIHQAPPDADGPTEFPDLALRRKFFLYVGGYDSRKNVPLLIQAYQKFIAPFYPIDLILVGGKGKGLETFVTDEHHKRVDNKYLIKPKGKVIFIDPVPQNELNCLYKQALALAHVSTYEGFNLALVEAMNAGIPIICSDILVHHEVTQDIGLFVDPRDLNSVGNAMHRLVHDAAFRRFLAKRGLERAATFSWKKTAEETLYVYSLFV